MNLAIIPARANSKRIKNKNILNFLGRPMMQWSILAAKKTKIFDKIIVSTDSEEISTLANKLGVETPFLRPKNISNSKAGIIEVVKHSINWFDKKKIKFENICCIFATAPLINYKKIVQGYKILKKKKYDFIFSAKENKNVDLRSFFFKNKNLNMLNNKFYHYASQDLPVTFSDVGQFYWGRRKTWINQKRLFSNNSSIIKIPELESCDINTYEDLKLAKKLALIKLKR